jgi:hypothetical protein
MIDPELKEFLVDSTGLIVTIWFLLCVFPFLAGP